MRPLLLAAAIAVAASAASAAPAECGSTLVGLFARRFASNDPDLAKVTAVLRNYFKDLGPDSSTPVYGRPLLGLQTRGVFFSGFLRPEKCGGGVQAALAALAAQLKPIVGRLTLRGFVTHSIPYARYLDDRACDGQVWLYEVKFDPAKCAHAEEFDTFVAKQQMWPSSFSATNDCLKSMLVAPNDGRPSAWCRRKADAMARKAVLARFKGVTSVSFDPRPSASWASVAFKSFGYTR